MRRRLQSVVCLGLAALAAASSGSLQDPFAEYAQVKATPRPHAAADQKASPKASVTRTKAAELRKEAKGAAESKVKTTAGHNAAADQKVSPKVSASGTKAAELRKEAKGAAESKTPQGREQAAEREMATAKGKAAEAPETINDDAKVRAEIRRALKAEAEARASTEQAVADARKEACIFGACVGLPLGIAMIALLNLMVRRRRSVKPAYKEEGLAEPLVKEPEPKLLPFDGSWVAADGSGRASIDGSKVTYDNGRQETFTDLDTQVLYTHRMTMQKTWFSGDVPVVKGATAKLDTDGSLRWDDGTVWLREEAAAA
mmetsp:Transcript_10135/g.32189  ORF Transcript_10135/g.32189 Transcript_10135/m.32189 type:complete len:315 (-) Transcript_10135:60-1004(-)